MNDGARPLMLGMLRESTRERDAARTRALVVSLTGLAVASGRMTENRAASLTREISRLDGAVLVNFVSVLLSQVPA